MKKGENQLPKKNQQGGQRMGKNEHEKKQAPGQSGNKNTYQSGRGQHQKKETNR